MERRKSHTNFYLEEMEGIYERSLGKADVPHRHDYYTVLLIEDAQGSHFVDYKKYTFHPMEVHFVSPGQIHQVALSQKPKGWVFTFSKDFLVLNNIEEDFISNINLFQPFGTSPPLKLDPSTFQRLRRIIQEMSTCLSLEMYYHQRALGALLQLFLIYCNNSSNLDDTQIDQENKGICILRDFKGLVEKNYRSWHKVKEYASEIHITPKHLSQTVKDITGKVAKEHIQDRIVLEAKRLLLFSDLSVKEIGYEVGFEEPLHFSGFFKKKVGTSPSQFRTGHNKK